MAVDEQALHQFIADQTDFPLDRVATVLRLGTPWPELMAIAARLSQIHHDADAAKAELHTVAAANADMLEMDVDDPVDVQEIADHIVGDRHPSPRRARHGCSRPFRHARVLPSTL